ncbi:MAG: SEC-C domain-containing protein [Clostridia bacterium]|nr:SEC-C domain-containing protein [Clostridia bacterium]
MFRKAWYSIYTSGTKNNLLEEKVGANEKCLCGSGKKYKNVVAVRLYMIDIS